MHVQRGLIMISNMLVVIIFVCVSVLCLGCSLSMILDIPKYNKYSWFMGTLLLVSSLILGVTLCYVSLVKIKKMFSDRLNKDVLTDSKIMRNSKYLLIIQSFWVIACLYFLLVALNLLSNHVNSGEVILGFFAMMGVLSFPLGMLVVILYMMEVINPPLNIWGNIVFPWVLFFICGYIQWFVILPRLVAKFREKKKREIGSISKKSDNGHWGQV